MLRFALIAISACIVPFAAHAGTVLESISKNLQGGAPETISTVLAQDGHMRIESKPGEGLMIFKDEAIYVVNVRDKSYSIMDRASLKRMADQLGPALKQMQEQMAKMPPEQRAQMERMMGGKMPGTAQQAARTVRKTSRTDKIGGYACSYVEIVENGTVADEMCVATPSSIKGGKDLMDAAVKMSALVKDAFAGLEAPGLQDAINQQVNSYVDIGGIPLLSRHYAGGKVVGETMVKSIRAESVPSTQFDLPAGYVKKELMPQR